MNLRNIKSSKVTEYKDTWSFHGGTTWHCLFILAHCTFAYPFLCKMLTFLDKICPMATAPVLGVWLCATLEFSFFFVIR